MAHRQATIEEVKTALVESRGIVSIAANKLGISTRALRKRVQNHESLQDELQELREQMKDKAENNIIAKIDAGDADTSRWYLASQARDRGYGNKLEVDGRIKHEVEQPDLSKLSDEELAQLEEIQKKLADPSAN